MFVPGSAQTHGRYGSALLSALGALGYEDGHNYALLVRWGEGRFDHFRDYAADLVGTGPDIISGVGTPVVSALKQQTQVIPVVFVQVADPVASGFVDSWARPGGNFSGFTNYEPAMVGKWLELLKEVVPGLTKAALVYDPNGASAGGAHFLQVFETAAASLSVKLFRRHFRL